MTTKATRRPYRPFGTPVWRTLIKASDETTFEDVARLSGSGYQTVVRMSRGEVETSPAVWRALSQLTDHPVEALQEAVAIRMQLVADEDSER